MNSLKIMLIGKSGVGKTTFAKYLKDKYGFSILKLAEPLYSFQNNFYKNIGANVNSQDSELLTILAKRVQKYAPDFLFNSLHEKVNGLNLIINDDCRRENFEKMKDLGFLVVGVIGDTRERVEDVSKLQDMSLEWTGSELHNIKFDFVISNNSSVDDYKKRIDELLGVLDVVNR